MKSPKLYFHDVGLAAHLLRIEDVRQIESHPLRGALFENLVVGEALKARTNDGRRSNLHSYRDSTGLEVDLVIDFAGRLTGVEVKASATARSDQSQGLRKVDGVLPGGFAQRLVVYDGDEEFEREGVRYLRPEGLAGEVRRSDVGG